MDEEKWNEEKIESYLKELPNVRDGRSKEDILKRLKADERLTNDVSKKKPVLMWVPILAAIAAVFLLMILRPSMQGVQDKADNASEFSSHEAETEASLLYDDASIVGGTSRVLLKETLGDDFLLPMGLVSHGQIVPVTFILSREQVGGKMAIEDVTVNALYTQFATDIDVEALGFDGYVEEADVKSPVSYFKYTLETGQSYLIPKESSGTAVEDAFLNLSNPPDEKVEPVIAGSLRYDVTIEGEIAKIHFEHPLDLSALEQEDALLLLEAFMLTAEQFQLAVQFENISPTYFDQYNLTEPLPKPIGYNPIYYLYE